MPNIRRRRAPLLVILTSTALVAGCGGDTSGPTDTRLTGVWTLLTVNDSTLPYPLRDAGPVSGTGRLMGGTLRFADTTATDSLVVAYFNGDTQVDGPYQRVSHPRFTSREDGLVFITRHGAADADYVDTGVVVGDSLRLKQHELAGTSRSGLLVYTRPANALP